MNQDIKARLGGLFLLLIGGGFGWYFILKPLEAAKNHAAEISYSLKVFVLVPFCLVFGLAFLVMGAGLQYRRADRKNLTLLGWVLFAIGGVLAAAGFFWFKQQFAALGYSDGV